MLYSALSLQSGGSGQPVMTTEARKRILAVDDDATALSALRQILQQRGYEVATAASGEQGLELAATQEFDLFILDVNMPGISGLEVCRRLRAVERTQNTPVIFLTAKGAVGDMLEGHEVGSDLYLVKPVMANKIVSMVGMFLSSEVRLSKKPKGSGPA
jgi:DNA-binding response OmpR family regulator